MIFGCDNFNNAKTQKISHRVDLNTHRGACYTGLTGCVAHSSIKKSSEIWGAVIFKQLQKWKFSHHHHHNMVNLHKCECFRKLLRIVLSLAERYCKILSQLSKTWSKLWFLESHARKDESKSPHFMKTTRHNIDTAIIIIVVK